MKDPGFLATAARSASKDVEKIIHAIETADQGTVDQLRKAISR
jgi:hypothetical protein